MTPIEAQGMQMELPAPAGTAPVELATVERGRIESTVRYTGQAVGFVEQDVTPRITGVITWMPLYVGDRVKRGQVLARLDTSQSAPQVAGQRAGLNMASQGVDVARKEYQQSLAAINEAHAEVGSRRGAVEGAKADLKAAQEERGNTQAQLDAAQSMTADAEAQLQAAKADQKYWQQEIIRAEALLKAKAVTQDEYQRERAQAENADAKVRQAQARITQVQAQVRAAQSGVRKSEAMIASANSKIAQAQSELEAYFARVRSTQAMADSARQKIAQAQAGVQQAKATLAGASASQGYSEIRSQTDGVVTQRLISPGVLVNPGQVILRIAQIAPIRLQANVPEADLSLVSVGSRVLVRGRNGESKPMAARVTSVAPLVDPAARTGVVETIVPNGDSRFLPGHYVTLDISTGSSAEGLLVPTRTLRYHTPPSGNVVSTESVPSLWVAEPVEGQPDQFTVRQVTVRVGRSNGRKTEILSGLQAGQKVVMAGQDYLKNGDTVSTSTAQVADAATTPMPPNSGGQSGGMTRSAPGTPAASNIIYTCIMHPEVVQDHPGDCPKCGMKLVPKRGGTR
jgi:RND family efflux transporter MFP subunit